MEKPFSDLKSDFRRYRLEGRNPLVSECFLMLVIHRMARITLLTRLRLLGKIFRIPLSILRKFIGLYVGINIPFSVQIGPGLFLPHSGGIVIHDNSVIGANCSIYHGVTLGAKGGKISAPFLGDHVNVGTGAKILGGIIIGDRVDVGANAVVLQDIPGNSIAVGIPAVVKPRNRQVSRAIFA